MGASPRRSLAGVNVDGVQPVMAGPERIHRSRFELKYIVSERCAQAIRDFSRRYVEPDAYARLASDHTYAVSSLYLDSPDLALCRATLDGHKHRFKLRVRVYDHAVEGPVFFEIKRRVDKVILKERAAVRRTSVRRLLAGHRPRSVDLVEPDTENFTILQRFCDLRATVEARGQVVVSYLREAYVVPNGERVRLTFDRKLSACTSNGALALNSPGNGFHPRLGGLILELKFTDRFPSWMSELVEMFDLQRDRMPKYVTCIQALRTSEFRAMTKRQRVDA